MTAAAELRPAPPYESGAQLFTAFAPPDAPRVKVHRPVDDMLAKPVYKCKHCSWGTLIKIALPIHERRCEREQKEFEAKHPQGIGKDEVQAIVNKSLGEFKTALLAEIGAVVRAAAGQPAADAPPPASKPTPRPRRERRGHGSPELDS